MPQSSIGQMTDVSQAGGNGRAIPISEVFYSIEGEGPYTGRPTLFIRTFGCNFTCRGFSNPGNEAVEVDPNVSMAKVKTDRGCDSIYSWHPEYEKFSKPFSVPELEAEVCRVIAGDHMDQKDIPWDNIIVSITGGEPLIHQKQLLHLLQSGDDEDSSLFEKHAPTILFETNGSAPLLPALMDAIHLYPGRVVFSVSPKLSNSGEPWKRAIRPRSIETYIRSGAEVYLKFVSDASTESVAEINKALAEYNEHLQSVSSLTERLSIARSEVWLMAEGATLEQQIEMQKRVAECALRNGWSFSPRAHVWIWGNTIGT